MYKYRGGKAEKNPVGEWKDFEISKLINNWYLPMYLLHNGVNDLIYTSKLNWKQTSEVNTIILSVYELGRLGPEAKLS